MSLRKLGLALASASAVTAIAAPAPSFADGIDIGVVCASTIGNDHGTVALRPVVRVDYQTCQEADTDG
jgi:hypothetical protein